MNDAYAINSLGHLRTKHVKKLYNASRSIRALCFLWILGSFIMLMVFLGIWAAPDLKPAERVPFLVILPPLLALNIATIIGCLKWTNWGRILGIISCVISLLGFPLGTLVGILGLIAFIGAPELFGPNRIDRKILKAEYQMRKQARRDT